MKTMRQLVALACTCGLLSGVTAVAAAPTEEVEVRVPYGDLDIQRPGGAKVLYERMQHAAARACSYGSYRELGSLRRVHEAELCYDEMLEKLVTKIDSDEVRALHTG